MGILLILAQVTFIVLRYGSHTLNLSPWIIWLPAILLVTVWLVGNVLGCRFQLDSFKVIYVPKRRRR